MSFDVDNIPLDKLSDKITIFIGGPDSWTSIVVHGDSTVELREQGKILYTLNLKAATKFIASHGHVPPHRPGAHGQ
jgi:hypothetical protein